MREVKITHLVVVLFFKELVALIKLILFFNNPPIKTVPLNLIEVLELGKRFLTLGLNVSDLLIVLLLERIAFLFKLAALFGVPSFSLLKHRALLAV